MVVVVVCVSSNKVQAVRISIEFSLNEISIKYGKRRCSLLIVFNKEEIEKYCIIILFDIYRSKHVNIQVFQKNSELENVIRTTLVPCVFCIDCNKCATLINSLRNIFEVMLESFNIRTYLLLLKVSWYNYMWNEKWIYIVSIF